MELHLKMSVCGILVLPNTHQRCGFYVHPYFCFRSLAPSLSGFTCGFDTPVVTGVTGSVLVPATVGTATILAAHGVAAAAAVVPTAEIPAVLAVTASAMQQYDLPSHLHPRIDAWTIAIYLSAEKVSS